MTGKERYQLMKRRAENSAIWFSNNAEQILNDYPMSPGEWTDHFKKLGKRFGLLREFAENGII